MSFRISGNWVNVYQHSLVIAAFTVCLVISSVTAIGQEALQRIDQRFLMPTEEEPDFRKHVSPILGKLGCNGRACHGSFQGQGGFQLSLFGFDFEKDYSALMSEGTGRVDIDDPTSSLILEKPTDADLHDGGKLFDEESWEYKVIQKWIEAGAKQTTAENEDLKLVKLEVHPSQIIWPYSANRLPKLKGQERKKEQWNVSTGASTEVHLNNTKMIPGRQLQVIAVWSDGKREDVTPLSRFSAADDQVAVVSKKGIIAPGVAGSSSVIVSFDRQVVPVPVIRPFSDHQFSKLEKSNNREIDFFIDRKLNLLGIQPSEICDDYSFLRRVMLDLTGTLPSASEVQSFQKDRRKNKRQILVEKLLKSPAYAAWWATRMSDWTGNNPRQLNNTTFNNLVASRQWQAWLQKRLEVNTPYDQIVSGIVTAGTREPGETYTEYCENMTKAQKDFSQFTKRDSMPYYWMRRNYRRPDERAISFAHAFLGVRIQCAQCHKHPFDRWTQNDFQEFSDLFRFTLYRGAEQGETRSEAKKILENLSINSKELRGNQLRRRLRNEVNKGNVVPFPQLALTNRVPTVRPRPGERPNRRRVEVPEFAGRVLGGQQKVIFEPGIDPRHDLMRWLRNDPNNQLAKAMVNRLWENYFGRGIVHPVDDFSQGNAPSHPELLRNLTDGFIENGYDLHWLHRKIILSNAYQRSWQPTSTNKYPQQHFARYRLSRIPSEVLVDAIAISTDSNQDAKAAGKQLQGRSVDQSSLIRANRNLIYPLAVFGKSKRETNCDCDRSSTISLLQTVFLQNDYMVYQQMQKKEGWLKEVQAEMASKSGPDPYKKKLLANFSKRLGTAQKRLTQLKRDGKRKQAREVERRIKDIHKRIAKAKKRPNKVQSTGGLSQDRLKVLIRQIYLKTVSRPPTETEIHQCLDFIKEDVNQLKGLQNVMHTILSSKEFVMNH